MYTTTTLVTNYLQRVLTANETAYLAILIPAIKVWLDKKLNSTFDDASATTRYYNGGVKNLDIDPCKDVTEIKAVNDDLSDSYIYDLTTTPEVIFEPLNETIKREARKRNGHFPSGIKRIALTAKFTEYDGAVPTDIQTIATIMASEVLNQGKIASSGGNVASESLEGHSINYDTSSSNLDGLAINNPSIQGLLEQRRELYVE